MAQSLNQKLDKAGTKEMIMIKNLMARRSEINSDTKRPMPSAVFS